MFSLKSLLCLCCVSSLNAQTFFRTNLSGSSGGSYSSVTHGASSHSAPSSSYAPAARSYAPVSSPSYAPAPSPSYAPAPAYNTYSQPKQVYKVTPLKPTYSQPAYSQPTYSQPTYSQPTYPQPQASAPTYGEKCSLDYVEKYAEVCVPTLETDCGHEKVPNGIRITEEYDCYPVTRTICTEHEEIELTDVCAVSYTLQEVASYASLVDIKWEKKCTEEIFCENPHSKGAYHAAAYCKEQIKSVCVLQPVVYPIEVPVILKLPQPYNTCITKEIILPRVKCQQVSENKCATRPKTENAPAISIDKCTVTLGQELCQDSPVKLPRQSCLETFKKTKLVYGEEQGPAY